MRFFVGYIFIGIMLPGVLFAQVERRTYHDPGKTQVKEIYFVSDTITNILQGSYTSFYLNGNPESRGTFEHNEATGTWEFYYETGILKTRAKVIPFQNNDGYYEYFYENGNISMEGNVVNKQQDGEWKFYFESGNLREAGIFRETLREGKWMAYFEEGGVAARTEYVEGIGEREEYFSTGEVKASGPVSGIKKNGRWTFFNKDGTRMAEGLYRRGMRTGTWEYFHADGQISSRGAYEKDKPTGSWQYYDEQGRLTSNGSYESGEKAGEWNIFYPAGGLKSSATLENGNGPVQEFYPSGEIRADGYVVGGLSDGDWVYYREDGSVEGRAKYENGKGTYTGYYSDGNVQTRGLIEEGRRIGRWELFDEEGNLTGYYKPIYDGEELQLPEVEIVEDTLPPRPTRDYGVADYKFKGTKQGYFDRRRNEFQGLIVETNPLMTLIGRFPVSLELYNQDRLGHKLEMNGIRDPFYKSDNEIALNEMYRRGYQVSLQQRFYNPTDFGLWYFGHEVKYTGLKNYARVELNPGEIDRVTADEWRIEYGFLLGYRLLQSTNTRGFTIDGYISTTAGYKGMDIPTEYAAVFEELNDNAFTLNFGFGFTFGYVFSFGQRRR